MASACGGLGVVVPVSVVPIVVVKGAAGAIVGAVTGILSLACCVKEAASAFHGYSNIGLSQASGGSLPFSGVAKQSGWHQRQNDRKLRRNHRTGSLFEQYGNGVELIAGDYIQAHLARAV